MADKQVQVTFTAPSTFDFDPTSVTMNGSGKVKFERAGANPQWLFVGAAVPNGGSQFSVQVTDQGKKMTIDDADTTLGTFNYNVTVSLNGTQATSSAGITADPPPQIVNAGPGGLS